MKRSEINEILLDADAFIRQHQFYLPPFAYWTPAEWRMKGEEACEIVENRLGWDIPTSGRAIIPKWVCSSLPFGTADRKT